ncbi:MAG: hypothetical protein ACLTDR_08390 [Adlercreutzia equolifaciens]
MSRWRSTDDPLGRGQLAVAGADPTCVADGAGRRRFSSLLMVEVLAARRDGDAEDFHIANIAVHRAVSRDGCSVCLRL